MANRILVTGANGFVGSALCERLLLAGYVVRKAVRDETKLDQATSLEPTGFEWTVLQDRSTEGETQRALQGVQGVIHLAARVHVMVDRAVDPFHEFRRVNRDWTERLARQAAKQGVRRFVYLSSIKVNGEASTVPMTEDDPPNPQDPYGVSKWEAEQALARATAETAMDLTIVRSPLVYGPGVRGNFLSLMNILRRGIPLPLARVHNRRSLIFQGNLVDALLHCIQDARAAGKTYLVSDGEDLSTPDLIRRLAKAFGLPSKLWPVPPSVLRRFGKMVGKGAMIDRLIDSLQVDSSRIRRELNWSPPYVVEQGLAETTAWYRACHG